jgi:hypothetical protein
MEQQLETAFLRPGLTERAAALGIAAVGIGMGILLAMWGFSFLWRYTLPEIRLANPEVTVKQDKPFTVEQPSSIKTAPGEVPAGATDVGGHTRTGTGDVLRREVTVFWNVTHQLGYVVTGWNYPDGRDGVPVREYCYYTAENVDGSSTKVDLATNSIPLSSVVAGLVPDLAGALTKCQWSQGRPGAT